MPSAIETPRSDDRPAAPMPGTCRVRSRFPEPRARKRATATDLPLGRHVLRVEPWVPPRRRRGEVVRNPDAFGPAQALRLCAVAAASSALIGCASLESPKPVQALTFAPVLRMDGGVWTADGAYAGGKVALKDGRLHEALMLFERAEAMRPRWDDAVNGQVVTLARLGRMADAIERARAAIVAGAGAAELHGNLGIMLLRSGQADEAWSRLEQAARLDPGNGTWTQALARRPALAPTNLAQEATPVNSDAAVSAPVARVEPAIRAPQALPAVPPAAVPSIVLSAPPVAVAPAVQAAPAVAVAPVARAAPVIHAPPVLPAMPPVQAPSVALSVPPVQVAPVVQAAPAVPATQVIPAAPVARAAPVIHAPQVLPAMPPVEAPSVALSMPPVQVAPVVQAASVDRTEPRLVRAPEPPETVAAAQPPAMPPAPEPEVVRAPTVATVSPQLRWDRSQPNVLALKMDVTPAVAVVAPKAADMPQPVQLADASTAAPKLRFTIEVSNGAGTPGLAKGTAKALRVAGVKPWRITNHKNFEVAQTEIQYRGAGDAAAARQLARKMGVPVALVQNPDLHASVKLRVLLGKDVASLPASKRLLAEGPRQLELFSA